MENPAVSSTSRFVDNATSNLEVWATHSRIRQRVRNASMSLYGLVRAVLRSITLENVRTIISVSLDLGRLIDRGDAFAMG